MGRQNRWRRWDFLPQFGIQLTCQKRQDGGHILVRLAIGEGAVVSPEGEGKGHALFAGRDGIASVNIKEGYVFQQSLSPRAMQSSSSATVIFSSQTTAISRVMVGNLGRGWYWASGACSSKSFWKSSWAV